MITDLHAVQTRLQTILDSDRYRVCSAAGAEIHDICSLLAAATPDTNFETVTVHEIYRTGVFERFSLYPYDDKDDDDLFCKPVDPLNPGAALTLLAFDTMAEAQTFAAGISQQHEIREYAPGLHCVLIIAQNAPLLLTRQDRRRYFSSRSPLILRVLDISTAHISPGTMNMLDTLPYEEWPVAGGAIDCGYFFYAHDENDGSIPEDLWAVIGYARRHGCSHVRLDRDADVAPDLPRLQ